MSHIKRLIVLIVLGLISTAGASTEKYRLIWNSSPESSMTVAWCQTDGESSDDSDVYIPRTLDLFFENIDFYLSETEIKMGLVPERLRGETASFEIKLGRKVIVEEGKRITANHVRDMEKSTVDKLVVPNEYLEGKILVNDIVDTETGELLAPANTELTEELVAQLIEAGIEHIRCLYVNDLDHGPFISNTLNIDPSTTRLEALVEIYRMMRPGEPPTKEAAENLFQNLVFNPDRYDRSAVGRMKFNRRVGRDEILGSGTLSNDDIVDVIRVLIDIRNGNGTVDDIDHLGNRRIRSVGEMAENAFRVGLVRVERAVRERDIDRSPLDHRGGGPKKQGRITRIDRTAAGHLGRRTEGTGVGCGEQCRKGKREGKERGGNFHWFLRLR